MDVNEVKEYARAIFKATPGARRLLEEQFRSLDEVNALGDDPFAADQIAEAVRLQTGAAARQERAAAGGVGSRSNAIAEFQSLQQGWMRGRQAERNARLWRVNARGQELNRLAGLSGSGFTGATTATTALAQIRAAQIQADAAKGDVWMGMLGGLASGLMMPMAADETTVLGRMFS